MSVHGKCHDVGRDSNELSSGRNEGSRPLEKKKEQKTTKIGLHRLCANDARNGGVWLKDNTEYFLSGEATTLNTSWMEQSPRQEEYLCRDPNAVVLKLGRNNTLATKALAQTLIPSTFSLVSNHLEIHRGSKFHLMCSQNSLKNWSWRSKSHS